MKRPDTSVLILLLAWTLIAVGLYIAKRDTDTPQTIGGDRDANGCLVAGGYTYDEEVGACDRSFELTPDIKTAAKLAVNKVGREYGLTVDSFNSYEEPGKYDITLKHGEDQTIETIYIENWKVISLEDEYNFKMIACDAVENGSIKEVKQSSRMFIKLPRDIYTETNILPHFKTLNGNATVGYVSNGGQPGDALDANAHCSSTYVEFNGIGVVELNVPSSMKGMPDYSARFLVTAFSN